LKRLIKGILHILGVLLAGKVLYKSPVKSTLPSKVIMPSPEVTRILVDHGSSSSVLLRIALYTKAIYNKKDYFFFLNITKYLPIKDLYFPVRIPESKGLSGFLDIPLELYIKKKDGIIELNPEAKKLREYFLPYQKSMLYIR
jgi:hypothetical protein